VNVLQGPWTQYAAYDIVCDEWPCGVYHPVCPRLNCMAASLKGACSTTSPALHMVAIEETPAQNPVCTSLVLLLPIMTTGEDMLLGIFCLQRRFLVPETVSACRPFFVHVCMPLLDGPSGRDG
jgi:hypothetical protein